MFSELPKHGVQQILSGVHAGKNGVISLENSVTATLDSNTISKFELFTKKSELK